MRLKIAGGCLFDPDSDWHGEVRDLYVEGDRIVARLAEVDRLIDARGQAVLAGGIDLRGQVASYGRHLLHLWNGPPPLPELGQDYAALGYTHVHEPFSTLYTAGFVHRRLAALPMVDTSASLVLNLRDLDLWLKDQDRWPEIGETISYLLDKTRSLEVRIVEPFVHYRQEFYAHRTIETDKVLEILTQLAQTHHLKLTLEATPEVLRAPHLEPQAFHLAALGQALIDDETMAAALRHLESGITADMGLPAPQRLTGANGPSVKVDLGRFQPFELRPAFSEVQVKRALKCALQYQGSNLAFSAAGPSLAPARDYAHMFAWLLNRQVRQQYWGDEVDSREYSLSEWAYATRTLPARVLGFTDRGHLAPGARADVALFDLPADEKSPQVPESFGRCRTLLKAGEVIIHNYQMVKTRAAKSTYFRQTGAQMTPLLTDICQYRSFRPENLWVPDELGGPWIGLE